MNFTKRGIDLLLVLILLFASGVVVYYGVINGGGIESPLPTATLTPTSTIFLTATITLTPTETLTPTLIPASAAVPTQTLTPTSNPSLTPSPTITFTPTLTATTTSTGDPISPLSQEIKDGISRGNLIVNAIEAYHSAMGKYPSAITDLVPAYMKSIPLTTTGQSYYYRVFDPASPIASEVYWLEFRAIDQDHVVCTYMRRIDYWDCNYDSP